MDKGEYTIVSVTFWKDDKGPKSTESFLSQDAALACVREVERDGYKHLVSFTNLVVDFKYQKVWVK